MSREKGHRNKTSHYIVVIIPTSESALFTHPDYLALRFTGQGEIPIIIVDKVFKSGYIERKEII